MPRSSSLSLLNSPKAFLRSNHALAIGFLAVGALSFIQYFQNMIDMHRAQRKAQAYAVYAGQDDSASDGHSGASIQKKESK